MKRKVYEHGVCQTSKRLPMWLLLWSLFIWVTLLQSLQHTCLDKQHRLLMSSKLECEKAQMWYCQYENSRRSYGYVCFSEFWQFQSVDPTLWSNNTYWIVIKYFTDLQRTKPGDTDDPCEHVWQIIMTFTHMNDGNIFGFQVPSSGHIVYLNAFGPKDVPTSAHFVSCCAN